MKYGIHNNKFCRSRYERVQDDTLRIMRLTKTISIDKNEYKCLLHSEANIGRIIEIRVLLFNLYAE